MTPLGLKAAEKRAADDMTLEQLRAEKSRVEAQIQNLLDGFRIDTGLAVAGLEIVVEETVLFGCASRQKRVRLKLEDL